MDDVQIINLYFARDENAIAETKNKYENMCYSVAHNILYNREDSEECVNDTWFFTWNSIPPKRPSILASFVSKITRNTAIDRYRKKNAQKRTDSHMEDIAGEVEKIGNIIASDIETYLMENQRIIAGNAQFTGIAAGRGVGFTTGLLLLREGLGMRETPIRPHSWH